MTDYLVDNSVWARLATGNLAITDRLWRIERAPADLFVTRPPQVLEFATAPVRLRDHAHTVSRSHWVPWNAPLTSPWCSISRARWECRYGLRSRSGGYPHRGVRHRERCDSPGGGP